MVTTQNTGNILRVLKETHYGSTTALYFSTPFELLVATILSAQTNDNQVNRITKKLFQKFHTPLDFAALTPEELENYIKTCGLYKMKAKHIISTAKLIVSKFDGDVPRTREELMELPGVGRKTANVVLSNAFGIPAMAVDTHVFRVARRLGLSNGKTPEETEQQLMKLLPEEDWGNAHHWLIWHGRKICTARNPRCADCPAGPYCPTYLGEEN